jgi:hypothetical protein
MGRKEGGLWGISSVWLSVGGLWWFWVVGLWRWPFSDFLLVWVVLGFQRVPCCVGLSLFSCRSIGFGLAALVFPCFLVGLFGFGLAAVAFPCILIGLLALPLCGAALTFFARRKESKQRKRAPTASQ